MKKNTHVRVLVVIAVIIILGFLVEGVNSYFAYSRIIRDDTLNITRLTGTNIYSDINNELIKPIFVSLTMANDSFVENWITQKAGVSEDEILRYLAGIQEKYRYSSAFLISAENLRYYHTDGVLKTIQPDDAHDVWYYDFLKSGKEYALDIDVDQANGNVLSIFINCRIEDANGRLLGVTGVALTLDQIREQLISYDDLYGVEAFLTNAQGLIQVHADPTFIEQVNLFDEPSLDAYRLAIQQERSRMVVSELRQGGIDQFLVSRYIPEMDWFLFVRNDTKQLQQSLQLQLAGDLAILLVVLALVLIVSLGIIRAYQQRLQAISVTDELTGIGNRRILREELGRFAEQALRDDNRFVVFIFDVDGFKLLNDSKGHAHGDKVLCRVVDAAKAVLGKKGTVYRWGGDEFAGVLQMGVMEGKAVLEQLREAVAHDTELEKDDVTVSIGLVEASPGEKQDHFMYQADIALYQAKNLGKNRVVVFAP